VQAGEEGLFRVEERDPPAPVDGPRERT
jgi:hypothetical protein